jgi:8-oxo-dGTP diphosphatase
MTAMPGTIENPQEMGDALVQHLLETETGHLGPGSLLIVREGEAAVFARAGQAWATFGPGQHTLTADLLPGLEEMGGAFDAEVYFVNTSARAVKWGTQGPIPLGDPAETVRGFGEATIQITDARQFVAEMVIGHGAVQLDEIQDRWRDVVHQALVEILAGLEGPASGLGQRLAEVAAGVQARLQPQLEGLGIRLEAFSIGNLIAADDPAAAHTATAHTATAHTATAHTATAHTATAHTATAHTATAHRATAQAYGQTGGPLSFLLNRPGALPPEAVARMMQAQNVKQALQELGLTVVDETTGSGMRYGISAASLIVQDGRLLLVHHREPEQYDFWTPPGGSLQGAESIFDCARRETREETGLSVELDRILYIQEFVEPGYHFCKFFILARSFHGTLTLADRQPDEDFLQEARFFPPEELAGLTVHPEILKDRFWQDREAECPPTRYLGLERIEE